MCGIAGIWSKDESLLQDRDIVVKMVGAIKKRGPDFQDTIQYKHGILGHARLSILDVSDSSNQPMADSSGRYSLVFNGEIYNFHALRSDLSAKHGINFRTSGDTEVLLQGLIVYGSDFISKLNGFFAFAFLDNERGNVLLARDRYGIKPLFYQIESGKITFASSLKAVAIGLKKKELDKGSLFKYLQYSYIPGPETIFIGVKKLLPGQFIVGSSEGFKIKQYYTLPKTAGKPEKNVVDTFRNLLTQSVEDRLISDVPLELF